MWKDPPLPVLEGAGTEKLRGLVFRKKEYDAFPRKFSSRGAKLVKK